MRTKASLPPIPPLSLEALRDVERVEEYVAQSIQSCSNPSRMSVNTERASRILRTCVVESLDIQLDYYASLSDYRPEWNAELATKTITSMIGFFPLFTTGEPFRPELERTVKEHFAQRARLKAAGENPQQLDRKKLRDSYFAAFREAKILDVCWAAGQRYSEWKRWLRHAVKDGSAPDRAFRMLLVSGKAPSDYRTKPRPHGWK